MAIETQTFTVRLPKALWSRMVHFNAATGVRETEQARRALAAWLTDQERLRGQLQSSLDATCGHAKADRVWNGRRVCARCWNKATDKLTPKAKGGTR